MVIACPGCGRTTSTYFQELAQRIQSHIRHRMPEWRREYDGVEDMTVAVMGCVVNGPGESKHANIGISLPGTGERPVAPVYEDGEKTVTLKGERIAEEFQDLVEQYVARSFTRKQRCVSAGDERYAAPTAQAASPATAEHCKPSDARAPAARAAAAALEPPGRWIRRSAAPSCGASSRFKDFYRTMSFVNALAHVANIEDHHPDLEVGYNYCRVQFTTHAIRGSRRTTSSARRRSTRFRIEL